MTMHTMHTMHTVHTVHTMQVPQPLVARRSFAIGLAASAGGSLFLAVSYPLAELVFRLARRPPPEEAAAFYGSLVYVHVETKAHLATGPTGAPSG